mgnify:CR=1 FL=1|jgi:hypothetical protein|tara:strand:+ start:26 stop:811 length:786 start_codon:yes stop_codon:yes gene_type:complete
MLWFLILNAFSVYFASQTLQMSPLIKSASHQQATPFSLVYDALYAVLIVLGLHQLNPPNKMSRWQQMRYTCSCHCGAIIFALAGEIPFLSTFALTPGFWKRLPWEGKIVISIVAAMLLLLVVVQCIRAVKKKNCQRQVFPIVTLVIIWGALWTLLYEEEIKYSIHVHHALFAGLFACFFNDFTTNMDVILNAILIGIVIEGIDFYGIAELTLFIIRSTDQIELVGVLCTWAIILAGLMFVIWKPTKKTKPKELSIEMVPVI